MDVGESPAGPPASDEVALAGADGAAAARLLRRSQATGSAFLSSLVRRALQAYGGKGPLLSRDDVKALADSLATVRASAELLGRSRVRERAERAGLSTFADEPLSIFRDELPSALSTPEAAVDYFMTLVPKLGIDPERFAGEQRRRAFTLAASANEVLTGKVRDRIAEGLKSNRSVADVTAEIQRTLDDAGVSHRNPQYSEMVYRTNAMDSFQAGVYEEGRHPDVRDLFPTWEYLGIIDHRTGEDHRPKIGRYYPSDATFADVRGDRPFNCRCSLRWVDQYEWDDLAASGRKVETKW